MRQAPRRAAASSATTKFGNSADRAHDGRAAQAQPGEGDPTRDAVQQRAAPRRRRDLQQGVGRVDRRRAEHRAGVRVGQQHQRRDADEVAELADALRGQQPRPDRGAERGAVPAHAAAGDVRVRAAAGLLRPARGAGVGAAGLVQVPGRPRRDELAPDVLGPLRRCRPMCPSRRPPPGWSAASGRTMQLGHRHPPEEAHLGARAWSAGRSPGGRSGTSRSPRSRRAPGGRAAAPQLARPRTRIPQPGGVRAIRPVVISIWKRRPRVGVDERRPLRRPSPSRGRAARVRRDRGADAPRCRAGSTSDAAVQRQPLGGPARGRPAR